MILWMRTTLIIDDALFHEAKLRAAHERLTVSELVSRALRDALLPPSTVPSVAPYRPLTFGDASAAQSMEPAVLAELATREELAELRR